MPLDCDLAAVVYDPPVPGLPHMAVLFDAMARSLRCAPSNRLRRARQRWRA